jgi:hypothetical protein
MPQPPEPPFSTTITYLTPGCCGSLAAGGPIVNYHEIVLLPDLVPARSLGQPPRVHPTDLRVWRLPARWYFATKRKTLDASRDVA